MNELCTRLGEDKDITLTYLNLSNTNLSVHELARLHGLTIDTLDISHNGLSNSDISILISGWRMDGPRVTNLIMAPGNFCSDEKARRLQEIANGTASETGSNRSESSAVVDKPPVPPKARRSSNSSSASSSVSSASSNTLSATPIGKFGGMEAIVTFSFYRPLTQLLISI